MTDCHEHGLLGKGATVWPVGSKIRYRRFGKTGWKVSQISLGTVELGVVYGLYRPDEPDLPDEARSVKRLRQAFDLGINLVDTAPGYGRAEDLLGHALSQTNERVYVATKVSLPPSGKEDVESVVRRSLEGSRQKLGRDRLDIVQVHNATAEDLARDQILDPLIEARNRGWIGHLGASVYGVDDALAACTHPEIAVVQVAYNLLDRRMESAVFAAAAEHETALLVRSALLKGVLTNRERELPAHLDGLKGPARQARAWADSFGEDLPRAAMRFCLHKSEIGSVLVGPRPGPGKDEFLQAVEIAAAPQLTEEELARAADLALDDEELIDPRKWGIP